MIRKNRETGLVLPSAPEFLQDGSWPPVAADWLPLSWGLFEIPQSDGDNPAALMCCLVKQIDHAHSGAVISNWDVLDDDFLNREAFSGFGFDVWATISSDGQGSAYLLGSWPEIDNSVPEIRFRGNSRRINGRFEVKPIELRRVVHSVRWRRKDPVTQLPPGTVHEVTHSVTTGLSTESTKMLSRALGLSLGGTISSFPVRIGSELRKDFAIKLEISSSSERSSKLTLSNQSENGYRLFAIWNVEHRITVSALCENYWWLQPDKRTRKVNFIGSFKSAWAPREEVTFVTDSHPFITYIERRR